MAEQRRQHPRVEPSARFPESGIDLVRSVKIETQLLARELALIDEHANVLASSCDNHAVAHLLRVRGADRHQSEQENYRPSVVGYLFDHGYDDPLSAQRKLDCKFRLGNKGESRSCRPKSLNIAAWLRQS